MVEAESVPKTKVTGWHLAVAADDETEPLGQRIVEVPEKLEYFALRDGRARFVAYVPPGGVQRGQALVASGRGKTVACGICHGPDLKGLGPIPGLAGRSPSYIVRQLYDFKTGTRAGAWSALMAPVVEELSGGRHDLSCCICGLTEPLSRAATSPSARHFMGAAAAQAYPAVAAERRHGPQARETRLGPASAARLPACSGRERREPAGGRRLIPALP